MQKLYHMHKKLQALLRKRHIFFNTDQSTDQSKLRKSLENYSVLFITL